MNDRKLAFIKASKYRQNIIIDLNNSKKTPKELSEKYGISLSHTSNLLSGLRDKNLVSSPTPNANKGKLYALTGEGREAAKLID